MDSTTLVNFWVQTQITVRELSNKAKFCKLTEAEAMMHVSMSRTLEEYYRIQTLQLKLQTFDLQKRVDEEERKNGES